MYKIFHIIASVQLGGAEIVAIELANHCAGVDGKRHDSTIIELYPTKNEYSRAKKEELSKKGIRTITLRDGSKRQSLVLSPIKLARLIKRENPDIIHSHTDLPDFALAGALRIFKLFNENPRKIVRTIHNTQLWRTHSRLGKYAESAFADDWIIGVSKSTIDAYKKLRDENSLAHSKNIKVIYNGCQVPKPAKHPFEIASDKINIAFCGRFEDYKGMETLISSIIITNERFPGHFMFHVIGDGTYKPQLIKLSKEYNNTIVYPPTPNISNKLHGFDFVFMPSHFEGLPLISIESSLSRVPVIASFAPGLDETLPDDWPLRFHLNDELKLMDIFEQIKNRTIDMDMLKEKAYNFATENFSLEKMVGSYSALYQEHHGQ